VSFFKLTWQGIAVPKNMIWLSPGDFLVGSPEEETGLPLDTWWLPCRARAAV
jgi:hypothetical protein